MLAKEKPPLTKTSYEDAITQYNWTKICLNDLEVSVETYLNLLTQTYQEPDDPPAVATDKAAVDGLQVLIDKNLDNLSEYINKFIDITGKNMGPF